MTKHVGVEMVDCGLLRPPPEHLGDTTACHNPPRPDPQRLPRGERVLGALPEIALDGLAGLVSERTGPRPLSLAQNDCHIGIKVNIGDQESCNLGEAHAGVQQEPDNRAVSTILESAAGHAGKQPADGCVVQYRDWLLRDGRRSEACQW